SIIEPVYEAAALARLTELGPQFPDPRGPDTAALDAAVERAKLDLQAWDDAFDADSDPEAFRRGRAKRRAALVEAEAARAEAVAAQSLSEEQGRMLALWRAGSPEAIQALWSAQ